MFSISSIIIDDNNIFIYLDSLDIHIFIWYKNIIFVCNATEPSEQATGPEGVCMLL